jgi:hypothetical protein
MYQYGVSNDAYHNMSGIPILSNQDISSEIGELGKYRFNLACPLAGPFITDITKINNVATKVRITLPISCASMAAY